MENLVQIVKILVGVLLIITIVSIIPAAYAYSVTESLWTEAFFGHFIIGLAGEMAIILAGFALS